MQRTIVKLFLGFWALVFWGLVLAASPTKADTGSVRVPADFGSIQAAINGSSDGDIILVSDGIYNENLMFNGRNLTLRSENGAQLTTIFGSIEGSSVVTFQGNDTSTLEGFTVSDGWAHLNGGGISVLSSSPKIKDCIIKNNFAKMFGGGIFVQGYYIEPVVIENTRIWENLAYGGGGICSFSPGALIKVINCQIQGNDTSLHGQGTVGGGILCQAGNAEIINSVIAGNDAGLKGGGISFTEGANLSIADSVIHSNTAHGFILEARGGGIAGPLTPDNPEFTSGFSLNIVNTIVWGNTVSIMSDGTTSISVYDGAGTEGCDSNGGLFAGNDSVSIAYSVIHGGWEGTGNADVDPILIAKWSKVFNQYRKEFDGDISYNAIASKQTHPQPSVGDYQKPMASAVTGRDKESGDNKYAPLSTMSTIPMAALKLPMSRLDGLSSK